MRFRLLIVGLGALIVTLTYTFPLWVDFLTPGEAVVVYPELTEDQRAQFLLLPPERQADYLAIREANPQLAYVMVIAALEEPSVVPDDEQQNPEYEGQIEAWSGEFVEISPNRSADGSVTIYELPDGSRYLWLEDFSVVNAPGLRLFLTVSDLAALEELDADEGEELQIDRRDLLLDPIRYTVGNQEYTIPAEADLTTYNSVMIFSTELNLVWAIAELIPES